MNVVVFLLDNDFNQIVQLNGLTVYFFIFELCFGNIGWNESVLSHGGNQVPDAGLFVDEQF
jgi:hypothetical protein